jgi:hypothetical protein
MAVTATELGSPWEKMDAVPATSAVPHARWWSTESIVFVGLWLVLMTVGGSRLFGDPGSFWHLVVGEQILSTGELVHIDPFSFTFAGKPWIAQQWLAECALALLHRVDGLTTILLATATIVAGLYTWLTHRLLRRGIHPLIAVLIAISTLLASSYHLHPRPHLLTIVLVAWTFARLCDFDSGRVSLRGLFWLVPVFVLWTNVHGGVVGGLAMVVAAVAGWSLGRLLGLQTPLRARGNNDECRGEPPGVSPRVQPSTRGLTPGGSPDLLPLSFLVLACAATTLVNPYGLELPRVWFGLIHSSVLPQLIQEHAPLRNAGAVAWTVLAFAAVYLIALAGVPRAQLRVSWLIPLLWLWQTWTSIRHGPLFAITAGLALAEMFPNVSWVAWLARKGSVTCRIRVPPQARTTRWGSLAKPTLIPAMLVLATATLQAAGVSFPVLGSGWARPHVEIYPTELLPHLRAYQQSRPKGTPIFNEMLFGGFLIYFTPDLRVFIDDRCELYGDDFLQYDADAATAHPERIEQWAGQYGFDRALVIAGSRLDEYLGQAPRWALVKRTSTGALYRREPEPAGRDETAPDHPPEEKPCR